MPKLGTLFQVCVHGGQCCVAQAPRSTCGLLRNWLGRLYPDEAQVGGALGSKVVAPEDGNHDMAIGAFCRDGCEGVGGQFEGGAEINGWRILMTNSDRLLVDVQRGDLSAIAGHCFNATV